MAIGARRRQVSSRIGVAALRPGRGREGGAREQGESEVAAVHSILQDSGIPASQCDAPRRI